MRWGQLLLCGWPGLARLWLRGHGVSLVIAVGFSILLNLALVATFQWPELLGGTFRIIAWPIIIVSGVISFFVSQHMIPTWASPPRMTAEEERDEFSRKSSESTPCPISEEPADIVVGEPSGLSSDTLFNRVQHEYLKGHWNEAETLLNRRIEIAQRDVEARLMLATLLRHTRRPDEATKQLKAIERLDDSIHWRFEIDRERQLISDVKDNQENNQYKYDGTNDDIDVVTNHETIETTNKAGSSDFGQQDIRDPEEQPDEHQLSESSNDWLC